MWYFIRVIDLDFMFGWLERLNSVVYLYISWLFILIFSFVLVNFDRVRLVSKNI